MPRRLGCLALAALAVALAAAWLGGDRDAPHVPTWGLMGSSFGRPVAYQACGFHTGQDWFAPAGTPVFAVADGTVTYVGPLWLDGPGQGRGPHAIVLDQGDHYTTYSHNPTRPGAGGRDGARRPAHRRAGRRGLLRPPAPALAEGRRTLDRRLAPALRRLRGLRGPGRRVAVVVMGATTMHFRVTDHKCDTSRLGRRAGRRNVGSGPPQRQYPPSHARPQATRRQPASPSDRRASGLGRLAGVSPRHGARCVASVG